MHDVELSDRQEFLRSSRNPDRKNVLQRTKNTPAALARGTVFLQPKLGFLQVQYREKEGNVSFPTVPRTSKNDSRS